MTVTILSFAGFFLAAFGIELTRSKCTKSSLNVSLLAAGVILLVISAFFGIRMPLY